MALVFGTKAETLERLAAIVTKARILPQTNISWRAWLERPEELLSNLESHWLDRPVIVRSSARTEDQATASLAGHFLSVPNVIGRSAVKDAITRVFTSYGEGIHPDEQIFIQPFLDDTTASGVAFTRDPNTGAPYIVINYTLSSATNVVTSGGGDLHTLYQWKYSDSSAKGFLSDVIKLLSELEALISGQDLDIEFALSRRYGLCLLQVRPLRCVGAALDEARHKNILTRIAQRIEFSSRPHPYLHGERGVFGVMPDWNPAEIIGTRPRPLALSLYRNLVTDQIWAYQRNNYGYKNLRSFPLLLSFNGLPYVDVRVSFNSFVPADIEGNLAERLVNYYLNRLREIPALHDKVEFEIVYSCYTLDLTERLSRLRQYGFTSDETQALEKSLRQLTNRIIHSTHPLWQSELERIQELETRRALILNADLDHISKIYWLLEDCKRWGTLPFAGLARAGFIAVQMLRSFVSTGIIDQSQYAAFMVGLDTVTTRMIHDLKNLDRANFLKEYGHLRPGTYDILSERYDEAPERYLGGETVGHNQEGAATAFKLTPVQEQKLAKALDDHGLEMSVEEMFQFLRVGIQGRERAKFVFTRSLSDVLSLIKELGAKYGLSTDDMSYADIATIEQLYSSAGDAKAVLERSCAAGRVQYRETCQIVLPPLIAKSEDVWSFHLPSTEPNYVTQGSAVGNVKTCDAPVEELKDAIVFIMQADPGFDWIFSKGIAGLVTAYGGVNSHMAIRAGECGLPAVIGAGEALFQVWSRAKKIRLDCAARRVEVIQ